MQKLIDVLEAETDIGFDMCDYYDVLDRYNEELDVGFCETVACIAGHAVVMEGFDLQVLNEVEGVPLEARNILGISEDQADALFIPKHKELYDITKQEAIETLKRFLKTGEVNWNEKNQALGR